MAITKGHRPALMNPNIAKHWITHLRSGWYEEHVNSFAYTLRSNDDHFSSFGVLCNIYAQTFPENVVHERHKQFFFGMQIYLPARVKEWADIHNRRLQEVASTSTEKSLYKETGFSDLFEVQKALKFHGFADFLEEHVVKGGFIHVVERFSLCA